MATNIGADVPDREAESEHSSSIDRSLPGLGLPTNLYPAVTISHDPNPAPSPRCAPSAIGSQYRIPTPCGPGVESGGHPAPASVELEGATSFDPANGGPLGQPGGPGAQGDADVQDQLSDAATDERAASDGELDTEVETAYLVHQEPKPEEPQTACQRCCPLLSRIQCTSHEGSMVVFQVLALLSMLAAGAMFIFNKRDCHGQCLLTANFRSGGIMVSQPKSAP